MCVDMSVCVCVWRQNISQSACRIRLYYCTHYGGQWNDECVYAWDRISSSLSSLLIITVLKVAAVNVALKLHLAAAVQNYNTDRHTKVYTWILGLHEISMLPPTDSLFNTWGCMSKCIPA